MRRGVRGGVQPGQGFPVCRRRYRFRGDERGLGYRMVKDEKRQGKLVGSRNRGIRGFEPNRDHDK